MIIDYKMNIFKIIYNVMYLNKKDLLNILIKIISQINIIFIKS